ncbi:MAG: 50S ribosomal protein L30 [Holosporales bacterium]|jgi:large subunit ribosomal protein L30|nr:50S ribosomal protein L30 [Holosporales bacterium]
MAEKIGKIKVKQIGSPIRRDRKQGLHLRALGLKKIGSERELIASNSILQLIEKVRHMIKVIS